MLNSFKQSFTAIAYGPECLKYIQHGLVKPAALPNSRPSQCVLPTSCTSQHARGKFPWLGEVCGCRSCGTGEESQDSLASCNSHYYERERNLRLRIGLFAESGSYPAVGSVEGTRRYDLPPGLICQVFWRASAEISCS